VTLKTPAPPAARKEESVLDGAQSSDGKDVKITAPMTVAELAALLGVASQEVQKDLMKLGILASLNQEVSVEQATRVAQGRGFTVITEGGGSAATQPSAAPAAGPGRPAKKARPAGPVPRPPVVVIMGHVDHGKTTLLDTIRKTRVTEQEYGGITQHIGAFQAETQVGDAKKPPQRISFLDTPGHEAFTQMRARGATVADIAVLVVAADDGVMPQTIEAIDHAKAAGLPIIVAVNKIDREDANPQRVLQQLTEHGIVPEAWGGDTITEEISAKDDMGVDDLLQDILLVAEISELTADPNGPASGTVIEARLDPARGPTATALIEAGTLFVGDAVVVGTVFGKIKALTDDRGRRLNRAGPASPVEILGLDSVPAAGDQLEVVESERLARQMVQERVDAQREERFGAHAGRVSLEALFRHLQEGEIKELNVVLKADVHGSVEAVRDALQKISSEEVRVNTIRAAVGNIGESDILLASASKAIVLGFNVKVDPAARRAAADEGIEVRTFRIIYDLLDAVQSAIRGMETPVFREVVLGKAEVRQTFGLPNNNVVAGCYVTEGKMVRGADVRVNRGGKVIHDGNISSLRHVRENVREIAAGYECGILVENFNEVEVGDILEAYQTEQVART
jgi:translation initiation factor IF-2